MMLTISGKKKNCFVFNANQYRLKTLIHCYTLWNVQQKISFNYEMLEFFYNKIDTCFYLSSFFFPPVQREF